MPKKQSQKARKWARVAYEQCHTERDFIEAQKALLVAAQSKGVDPPVVTNPMVSNPEYDQGFRDGLEYALEQHGKLRAMDRREVRQLTRNKTAQQARHAIAAADKPKRKKNPKAPKSGKKPTKNPKAKSSSATMRAFMSLRK